MKQDTYTSRDSGFLESLITSAKYVLGVGALAALTAFSPVRTQEPKEKPAQEARANDDLVRKFLNPAQYQGTRQINGKKRIDLKDGAYFLFREDHTKDGKEFDSFYLQLFSKEDKELDNVGLFDDHSSVHWLGKGSKELSASDYEALRKYVLSYVGGNATKEAYGTLKPVEPPKTVTPEPKPETVAPETPKSQETPVKPELVPALEDTLRAYFNTGHIKHRTHFKTPVQANKNWTIPEGIEVILDETAPIHPNARYLFEKKAETQYAIAVYDKGAAAQTGTIALDDKGKSVTVTPDYGELFLKEPRYSGARNLVIPFFEGADINPRDLAEKKPDLTTKQIDEPKKEAEEPEAPPYIISKQNQTRILTLADIAVNKSTLKDGVLAALDIPLVSGFAHVDSSSIREALSDDRIRDTSAGLFAKVDLGIIEASLDYGFGSHKRSSSSHDSQSSFPFTITTDVDVVERVDTNYLALRGEIAKTFWGTLYRSANTGDVTTTLTIDQQDLSNPANNYRNTTATSMNLDSDIIGGQFGIHDDLGALVVGAVGDIERFDNKPNDEILTMYRLDFFGSFVEDRWGVSGGLGKRLTLDSEAHRKFDPVDFYANFAVEKYGTTAFGSVWRLDRLGAGGGLVFGSGNAVKMIMDYRDQQAWAALDLMKEMGPNERNTYLRILQYDFLNSLARDDKLRFMIFGGAQRNIIDNKEHWGGLGEAGLNIPLSGANLIPFANYSDDGEFRKMIGGLRVRTGGLRFSVGAGGLRVRGAKDPNAQMYELGLEAGF
jgi:hypothetical protein